MTEVQPKTTSLLCGPARESCPNPCLQQPGLLSRAGQPAFDTTRREKGEKKNKGVQQKASQSGRARWQNHKRLFVRATAAPPREGRNSASSSLPRRKDEPEPSLLSSHTPQLPVGPIPGEQGTGSQAHPVCPCPCRVSSRGDIPGHCSPEPMCPAGHQPVQTGVTSTPLIPR